MNKSDVKKLKWESSEFPILCNKCLGPGNATDQNCLEC